MTNLSEVHLIDSHKLCPRGELTVYVEKKEHLFRKKMTLSRCWGTIRELFHSARGLSKSTIWTNSNVNANKTEDF